VILLFLQTLFPLINVLIEVLKQSCKQIIVRFQADATQVGEACKIGRCEGMLLISIVFIMLHRCVRLD